MNNEINTNETSFETFMKEQKKKKKQTIIWRVFTTVCLAAIIILTVFRALHCDCDCQKNADNSTSSYSSSAQMADSSTADN